MLPRAACALSLVAAALLGCGDLFHGTDWSTRCELDASAEGCPPGAGGASASTSGSSSSAGGAGGGGAGMGGASSSTSASSMSSSSASSSGTGGSSPTGCSDGTREGFTDLAVHPTIAACSGGFSVPGVSTPPSCAHSSGNDSTNPSGVGCSAGDLCAAGWHVCTGAADVTSHSSNGCADASGVVSVFFAVQVSGPGSAMCGTGHNDVFGCGNLGGVPDAITCAPLDRFSSDLCAALGAPWSCGIDDLNESIDVTKQGPTKGGVICCTD